MKAAKIMNFCALDRKWMFLVLSVVVCPSPLVAMPDDQSSPYRLCNPRASLNDPIEGCTACSNCTSNSHAVRGQCVYSNNLSKLVCCAVDVNDLSTLRRRGDPSKKRIVVKEKWIKVGSSDSAPASFTNGCASTGCHPNYPGVFSTDSSSRNIYGKFANTEAYWKSMFMVMVAVLVVVFMAGCMWNMRAARVNRMLATVAQPFTAGLADKKAEPEITCIYNPYSECPVKMRQQN